jgi:L-alanine-DL-glutamate epimerase-like enolase superfamily enzyme
MRVDVERLRLAKPFRIAGHVFTETPVAIVMITEGERFGRGEGAGVYYLDDDIDKIVADLEGVRALVEEGLTRQDLQTVLPACGARNALDCAMWELEAQRADQPVWSLAGLTQVRPLVTAFTLGAESPDIMREAAANYSVASALKLKLTGEVETDVERVRAVREARPDCWIGVDANQGFTLRALEQIMPTLLDAKVALIEQPLRRGDESLLRGFVSPIPLAADESVQTSADLPAMLDLFSVINIKLDKSGGLTEGLAMAQQALALGFEVMVGNMTGSSLAMAPGFVLGQYCSVVDLDGPTFLAEGRRPSVSYAAGKIWCPDEVWGGASSVVPA